MKDSIIFITHFPQGTLFLLEKLKKYFNIKIVIIQKKKITFKDIIKKIIKCSFLFNIKSTNNKLIYFKSLNKEFKDFSKQHNIDNCNIRSLKKKLKKLSINFLLTHDINTDNHVKKIIKEKKFKYIFVFGGSVISKQIKKLSKVLWINGHGGILPQYRGLESEFWAIRRGDFNSVGATIHELTSKVDFGKIFLQKAIQIDTQKRLIETKAQNYTNLVKLYLLFAKKLFSKKVNIIKKTNWRTSIYYSAKISKIASKYNNEKCIDIYKYSND
jgi:folate-dependent phosphoribosylglycinamide formyltransferase PurN